VYKKIIKNHLKLLIFDIFSIIYKYHLFILIYYNYYYYYYFIVYVYKDKNVPTTILFFFIYWIKSYINQCSVITKWYYIL